MNPIEVEIKDCDNLCEFNENSEKFTVDIEDISDILSQSVRLIKGRRLNLDITRLDEIMSELEENLIYYGILEEE